MTYKILLSSVQTTTGYALLQDENVLYVLSNCHNAKLKTFWDQTVSAFTIECVACQKNLGLNEGTWSVEVDVAPFQRGGFVPTSISKWGEFWFGLEEFGILLS